MNPEEDRMVEKRMDRQMRQLRGLVTEYLNNNVIKPSLETIEKDFFIQDKLVSLLVLVNKTVSMTQKEGISFDKELLRTLPREEIEKRIEALNKFISIDSNKGAPKESEWKEGMKYILSDSSRKYLLSYLAREINWIVISILSASYVSSLVLMRAVFELLVGIATLHTGSMSHRIKQIKFLEDRDKIYLKKLWGRLCGWGHPYGKWLKEVCPIYAAYELLYHPKLCKQCVEELTKIIDFFLVIAIAKFEVKSSKVERIQKELNMDAYNFKLLSRWTGPRTNTNR